MYTIVIGNKNYSSWSLRGWLAVRACSTAFEEILIPLDTPEWSERIAQFSPSNRVPVLIDGDTTVWDSLAIIEYLAELHPDAGHWPKASNARAHARSAAAEMHSGFSALRAACPMNMRRSVAGLNVSEDVSADLARISELWAEARRLHGADGPFLYGKWSAADMMFAPVVSRIRTYALYRTTSDETYMEAVEAHPDYVTWREAALKEEWVVDHDEID